MSFSLSRRYSLLTCGAVTLLGCFYSFNIGLVLLGLLVLIGSTEIMIAWQQRYKSDLVPLPSVGIYWVCVGYSLLLLSYIGIIWFFAGMGDDVLGLPLKILYS